MIRATGTMLEVAKRIPSEYWQQDNKEVEYAWAEDCTFCRKRSGGEMVYYFSVPDNSLDELLDMGFGELIQWVNERLKEE